MQRIGVKTVKVAAKPLQKIIRTVGRIEADERNQTTINAKIEGWIEKLYVDYTGQIIKKGEPLADVYSPELLATQQEFLNTLKWSKRQTGKKAHDGHDHPTPAGSTGDAPDAMFDLQKMLLEIQDDEAIDIVKATHLSQDQIQELVTRRKAQDTKRDSKPSDAS